MAHYNVHGFDGYGMKEPKYRAAVVGYSATAESYTASTEEVVQFRGYPNDQMWPRIPAYHKKGDDHDRDYSYSPKFSSPQDSPRKTFHRAKSPPLRQFPGMYKTNGNGHHDSPHIQFKKGDDYEYDHYSPKFNGSPHDSPRKTFHRPNSPHPGMYTPHDSTRKNFREHFSGTDDDSSDDDDVECRDGVCYPKPKHGQDYNKEKKKGNGHGAAGNYPLINSTDHQYQPHYIASEPRKYYTSEKQPEAENIYGGLNHTKPMGDRFSYPTNNEHNRSSLAPIKTRPDRHRDAQWPPFGGSPKKEAQRPYGTQSDHEQKKIIDSETLAKMYGGVFVK